MSVRCITRVLDSSRHAGTELLMLVVLADYSDDDGNSYPAVASLARKCRMTSRNAIYILNRLQASSELRVLKNEGPKGTNRYRIMLALLGEQPLKPTSPLKAASPLKPTSAPPEAGFRLPLKPTSPEPSLNRQEPSKRKRASTALTSLPDGFAISQRVRDWASPLGFIDYLPAHLEHFVGTVKASGKRYADWDQALMNYIRNDWGDVRKRAGVTAGSSDKPKWALDAGFQNRFEAENDGCHEHNAMQFRDGKRAGMSA